MKALHGKLLAVANDVPAIEDDKANTYSNYSYASLEQIRTHLVPVMVKHGVSVQLVDVKLDDDQPRLAFTFQVADAQSGESMLVMRTKPFDGKSKAPRDKQEAGMVTTAWREVYCDLFHLRCGVKDDRDHEQDSQQMDQQEQAKLLAEAEAVYRRLPPQLQRFKNGVDRLEDAKRNDELRGFTDWGKDQLRRIEEHRKQQVSRAQQRAPHQAGQRSGPRPAPTEPGHPLVSATAELFGGNVTEQEVADLFGGDPA
ncbi:MAG: ERF family protein [Gemmatimonadota bacterium]|nr:MAG: ERF family protein [Gemmatimonadota bacterium]